jgi:hypothetical protein
MTYKSYEAIVEFDEETMLIWLIDIRDTPARAV